MIWIWWRGGQTDMWWGGIDESRKEWGEWEAWTPVSIYLSTPPSLTLTPYTIIHFQASPPPHTASSLGHGHYHAHLLTIPPYSPSIPTVTYIAAALDGLKLSHDVRAVQLGKAP